MALDVTQRAKGGLLGSSEEQPQTAPSAIDFTTTRELCRIETKSGEARPWTITLGDLGMRQLPFALTSAEFAPFRPSHMGTLGVTACEILFGTGGQSQRVVFDWRMGQVVTVWGSSVTVSVIFDQFNVGSSTQAQRAKAWITEGQLSGHLPPTFSWFIAGPFGPNFASVISPVLGIPQFARRVSHTYDQIPNTVGGGAMSRVLEFFVEFAAVFFRVARYEFGGVTPTAGSAYPEPAPVPMIATHFAYRVVSTTTDHFSIIVAYELAL